METMKPVIKVVKATSKKGNSYCAIVLDLGYRKVFLNSVKDNTQMLCAEILGISPYELLSSPDFEKEI